MKRKRTIIPGASYFVTVKTNGGVKYLASPLAKTMFVETLERLKVKHDCCIGNFVVLDDEIQLIIKPAGDTSLAETMKWLLGVYTQNHNRVFDGFGHIFGSRYDSRPIESLSDLGNCFARIDQAPVLGGLVTDTMDWEWCGLRQRHSACRDVVEDTVPWLTLEFFEGSVVVGYCS